MTAIDDIAAERKRQIAQEGWSPEHDDTHSKGEMAKAAGVYALFAGMPDLAREVAISEGEDTRIVAVARWWPWERRWWKPKDRRRDLVRAGALIVAEIERLDRENSHEQ